MGSIARAKYNIKTENGYEQLHLETSSDVVLMNDGRTVQTAIEQLGHSNIDTLDKLGEDAEGKLTFNNETIKGEKGDTGNSTKWYDGVGVPTISLGEVGSYYLSLSSSDIYRKETDSRWERRGALKVSTHIDHPKGIQVNGKVSMEFNSETNSLDFVFV